MTKITKKQLPADILNTIQDLKRKVSDLEKKVKRAERSIQANNRDINVLAIQKIAENKKRRK